MSLLDSFGKRTLAILRAVKDGATLLEPTIDRLVRFGFASRTDEGLVLTIAGEELLSYLESLALAPDEHVEFLEVASGSINDKKRSLGV